MKLNVVKPFSWAHQGVRVESFAEGQVIETDDEDLIRVALKEKWVKRDKAGSAEGQASTPAAAEAAASVGDAAGQATGSLV